MGMQYHLPKHKAAESILRKIAIIWLSTIAHGKWRSEE